MIDNSPTPTPATPAESAPRTPAAPGSPPAAPAAPPGTAMELAQRLNAGTITINEAAKLSKGANIPMLQVAQAASTLRNLAADPKAETRTPAEQEADRQFGAPARPSDFRIAYGRPGEDVKETPELKAFDANARGWLAGAGFVKSTGESLVAAITKTVQATQHMTEGELETYASREWDKLTKVHGPALEQRLHDAAVMIDQLERQRPGLKQLLKSRGVGDSAIVASLLIQQAERYHTRRGAQGTR